MLPVFLAVQGNEDEEIRSVVEAFFGELEGVDREAMSGVDAFKGINRIVQAVMPEMLEQLAGTTIEVEDIEFDVNGGAVMKYAVLEEGEILVREMERFQKEEGKWYLRVSNDPAVVARSFRQMFGLEE